MWNRQETASRQTENDELDGIEHYDIILNCTYTNENCPPFINDRTLQKRGQTLQIIGDVTCDTTKDKNRMRFSTYKTTDFDDPAFKAHENIYTITIDHSPSLFPKEASEDMVEQFYPHLLRDKKLSPELCSDYDLPYNSYGDYDLPSNYNVAKRAFISKSHLYQSYERWVEDYRRTKYATNLDNDDLQSKISYNLSTIKALLRQSPENEKIILYAIACSMVKLSNPMAMKPKFYTPKENPEKTEVSINKIVTILNEKIK